MKGNQNPFGTAVSKALAVTAATLIMALILATSNEGGNKNGTVFEITP